VSMLDINVHVYLKVYTSRSTINLSLSLNFTRLIHLCLVET